MPVATSTQKSVTTWTMNGLWSAMSEAGWLAGWWW
jgi:hypothetical protein